MKQEMHAQNNPCNYVNPHQIVSHMRYEGKWQRKCVQVAYGQMVVLRKCGEKVSIRTHLGYRRNAMGLFYFGWFCTTIILASTCPEGLGGGVSIIHVPA